MKRDPKIAIQVQYAPKSICYGCGPSNPQGLHVESFDDGDKCVAHWKPQPHHHAFPGTLNGGIIGSILDCHCNWTAAWHLMKTSELPEPPCTVTAEYTISLLRPTPDNETLLLTAWVTETKGDRVYVEAKLEAQGKITAKCKGLFVAVKPGHPGYHRW